MAPSLQEELDAMRQRLTNLEAEFAALQSRVLGATPRTRDWRRTAGTFPRDEVTLEAERLGREWRAQSTEQ